MPFGNPFGSPFGNPFGSPFGTTPAQSPLQQAVIAAWDMQEESGPLLPAKGGIEIPAFNSPGTTIGPGGSISARSLVTASSQYFRTADDEETFSLAGRVIRAWLKVDSYASSFPPLINKSASDSVTSVNDQWSFFGDVPDRVRFRTRNDANAGFSTNFGPSTQTLGNWWRVEVNGVSNRFRVDILEGSTIIDIAIDTPLPFEGAPFAVSGTNGFNGAGALLAVFNWDLTTDERTADLTPRLYGDL